MQPRIIVLAGALVLAGATLVAFTAPDAPATSAVSATTISPGTYTIDKAHSTVGFRVRHLGISNVAGSFSDFDATVTLDPADLTTFAATATVNVASIDTRNERRDNHLRSEDFFAADQYPQLRFVSTGVRNVSGNRFQIEGDLTMRGVTRPVVLDAEMIGAATGPDGSQRVGVEARTTVDRHDYGLNWSRLTEAGGVVVARDVEIILDIQAIRS
jgi:polyisoprenoid-binding protein YceI